MNSGNPVVSLYLYNSEFQAMIQILKLVYSPNTIKMALLQTCVQTNHDISFSEPKQEQVIELSHCA
jgi:hypothetical protein